MVVVAAAALGLWLLRQQVLLCHRGLPPLFAELLFASNIDLMPYPHDFYKLALRAKEMIADGLQADGAAPGSVSNGPGLSVREGDLRRIKRWWGAVGAAREYGLLSEARWEVLEELQLDLVLEKNASTATNNSNSSSSSRRGGMTVRGW